MTKLTLAEFLQAIPKAELHCHLPGTVRKETFLRMAERARAPLSAAQIDEFYTRTAKPVNVSHVLRAVDQHLIKRPDDLYEITIEYLQDAASHGVRYSEFFWVPTGTVSVSGIPYERAQEAIVRAIEDAQAQFGIIARVIPSIDRQASPAAAMEMLEWVLAHRQSRGAGNWDRVRGRGAPTRAVCGGFHDCTSRGSQDDGTCRRERRLLEERRDGR